MRNKSIASLIALFGGWCGLHKFYLGENWAGVTYFVFSWTMIPSAISFFEFFRLIFMSEQTFNAKFNYYYLTPNVPESITLDKDKVDALLQLKNLYDQSIITAEEFEEKRRYLLDKNKRNIKHQNSLNQKKNKIDINTCSKDELVYDLGIPIIYANDIEYLRHQGHLFTYLEELSELAGLPENYIKQLEPFVTFTYDLNKELAISWQRLNVYSQPQLINCGLDQMIAQQIIKEREKNGTYRSVIDVQRRTGIPMSCYRHLI